VAKIHFEALQPTFNKRPNFKKISFDVGAFKRKFTDGYIGNSKRNATADYIMKIFTECLDHYGYIH
jgi:hypothetical protein